jgi:hypothetical protein
VAGPSEFVPIEKKESYAGEIAISRVTIGLRSVLGIFAWFNMPISLSEKRQAVFLAEKPFS